MATITNVYIPFNVAAYDRPHLCFQHILSTFARMNYLAASKQVFLLAAHLPAFLPPFATSG